MHELNFKVAHQEESKLATLIRGYRPPGYPVNQVDWY